MAIQLDNNLNLIEVFANELENGIKLKENISCMFHIQLRDLSESPEIWALLVRFYKVSYSIIQKSLIEKTFVHALEAVTKTKDKALFE